jgi:hypothetical protein
VAEDQHGTHILVASDVRVERRIFHLSHSLDGFASFGFLGVIDEHVDDFPLAGVEGLQHCLGLLAKGSLGIPPLAEEGIVKPGPVVLSLQVPVQVGRL